MRPLQSIKTLFRTPFKTLFTFLLLTTVMFALFSRVGEYSITSREIKNIAKEYRGVGSTEIEPAPASYPESPFPIYADPRLVQDYSSYLRYQPLSQKQIRSILELLDISSVSTRYMTPGVSNVYYRMDDGEGYHNYTARFIVEGTLSDVDFGKKYGVGDFNDFNDLILDDCTVLAGNPPWSIENKKITFHAYSIKLNEFQYSSISAGVSRVSMSYDDSYIYDTEYIKKLTIGKRYVFIGRYEPLIDSINFYLSDQLTNQWCESIQSVEDQPANYLETEKFAPLRELIEITNSDLHTFDVVYTDDMSAIMRFAEGNMSVISGRELTKEDSEKQSKVCVVSNDFASNNDLDLGDKIKLKLGTELFEQYKNLGAVAATRERYTRPDETVELEIIGIYMDTDSKKDQLSKPNWCYSINTVFVPKSLLPLDESQLDNHVFSPSEFSFTVDDAWDIPSFLDKIEKTDPIFKKKGLKIIFHDDGWPEIVDKLTIATKLSFIAIVVLSIAVVAATGLIVYLFIGRKKKEYAILRAMGVTRKESAKSLLLPLMVLTVSAVLVGSCTAWIYLTNTVSKNTAFANIKDYTVNTSMPIPTVIGCIMGEILFVLVFALYRLWRIGRISPLMLLQDNQNKKAYKIKKVKNDKLRQGNEKQTFVAIKADTGSVSVSYDSEVKWNRKHNRHSGFLLRYITKHIRRSGLKTILSILLSVLMFGAVGQFETMRQSYIDLCDSTEIKAKFLDGLPLSSVSEIIETGYVMNPYYEFTHYADFNYSKENWVVTNDIAKYTDEEIAVTYAPGYDESCMKKLGNVCIISSKLLEQNGLQLGDKVYVTISGTLKSLQSSYISKYKIAHPDEVLSDAKILELSNEELTKELSQLGSYYTVVGTVSTPTGKYDETVFSPGTLDTIPIFGTNVFLELAEFTIMDNLQVEEFRSYAKKIDTATFIMDTSKIDNVIKSLSLFDKLIPIVLAAAVLIEGLVCGLIIMQSSKEVAILRVLGTTRRRTCVILMLEQVFHCIVGLLIGALGLLLYNGSSAIIRIDVKLYLVAALYFAGCIGGSFICSIITTNRKVLDLLQSKE